AHFRAATANANQVLVVEQNHGGQFFEYLNAQRVLPANAESLAQPGPLPIKPNEIFNCVLQGL
ncbi:MAG: 2-oxoglutarate synthase, partial [Sedimenticola sp.]|nr:2-oxoglutarate synthase [Sedimenticola sp.]MCW8975568.1 2-oxoglutarate synthase [Sedimenticola sp.]